MDPFTKFLHERADLRLRARLTHNVLRQGQFDCPFEEGGMIYTARLAHEAFGVSVVITHTGYATTALDDINDIQVLSVSLNPAGHLFTWRTLVNSQLRWSDFPIVFSETMALVARLFNRAAAPTGI